MKLNLVVLTIALMFSIIACGGDSKKKQKKAEPEAVQPTTSQRVIAGPNGQLRVCESTVAQARKVKEVVVGADGKLMVVEKTLNNTNPNCVAPMPNQMCMPQSNPCVTPANPCMAPTPKLNPCVTQAPNPCTTTKK